MKIIVVYLTVVSAGIVGVVAGYDHYFGHLRDYDASYKSWQHDTDNGQMLPAAATRQSP